MREAREGAASSHQEKVPWEGENSLAGGRWVEIQVRLLATTLASPYLLNHFLALQKALFQTPRSESLSAVSQEKRLNPQGEN